jgi:DNA-binding MarR family transcriptional regulator
VDDPREPLLDAALGALTSWTVLVVQFNGMVAARLGVTESDLQCLFVLAQHGPTTASALATQINLTTGSVSRMIDRLNAAGHVTRHPDPADRRRVIIAPSPAALEQVAAGYEPLTTRLRADLDGFDEHQLGLLLGFARAAGASTEQEIRALRKPGAP